MLYRKVFVFFEVDKTQGTSWYALLLPLSDVLAFHKRLLNTPSTKRLINGKIEVLYLFNNLI